MELKEFISKAIDDIVDAVQQSDVKANREVKLASSENNRTIEFDIAVSAEEKSEGKAGGGIKVWGVLEGEASNVREVTNSTISRLRFGVNVDQYTKEQHAIHKNKSADVFNPHINRAR